MVACIVMNASSLWPTDMGNVIYKDYIRANKNQMNYTCYII